MDQTLIDSLRERVLRHRDLMRKTEETIWKHPETGYREWKTHAYLKRTLEDLGYTLKEAGDIPGFTVDLPTGRPGPTLVLMAEMDSVLCAQHPDANPETGAVHACGHHAQCAALVGAAAALKEPGALEALCGTIRLMFVPAEELLELEYRETLRQKGTIRYYGGKPEFMRRGFFDGADLCVMLHTGNGKGTFALNPGQNGCIVKQITYLGRAAHAGGSPHKGINALYAADLGMSAVNALRETFRDEDHIRFHPIITGPVGAVNVIPDEVRMESYVRGASMEAIAQADMRIDRALAGAAASMGARVHIRTRAGYSPVINDPGMYRASKEVMQALVGAENVEEDTEWGTGCTDMGDISCVFPAIHPHGSGAKGLAHGSDFFIEDPESAVDLPAAFLTGMCACLLGKDAVRAGEILKNFKPLYPSISDYLKAVDRFCTDNDAVTYGEDGTITIR